MSSPSNRPFNPLMLNGTVDNRDAVIAQLESELRQLRAELAQARSEASAARQENVRAITAVRHVLDPLYGALRMVYGEMEQFDGDFSAPSADKWGAVKQRLAPRLREAVDILLLQGTMRRTQLANALKMDYSNCTKNVISVLVRQGWVVDNGGNLSLKEL